MSFLELIAGAIVKWLAGWIGAREAQRQAEKVHESQAQAVTQSAVIRDQADAQVEAARERSAGDVGALRNAGAGPDGLRKQLDTLDAAIGRANGDVR